jgi:hypothetical protein
MSEEEQTKEEEGESQETSDGSGDGDKQEEPSVVEQANAAKEGLDKSLAEAKELVAKGILSGKAVVNPPTEKKEESPADYAKRIMNSQDGKEPEEQSNGDTS